MKTITTFLLATLLSFAAFAKGEFTVLAPDGSLELPKSIFAHHRGFYGGEGESWCYLRIYDDYITQGVGWDVTKSNYREIMQTDSKILIALEGSTHKECTTNKFWEFDFSEYLLCLNGNKGCDTKTPVFKVRTFKSEESLLEATPSDYGDFFYDYRPAGTSYEELDEISLYYFPDKKDAAYKLKNELESQGFSVKIMDASSREWLKNSVNFESYTYCKYRYHVNLDKVNKIAFSVLGHDLKPYTSKKVKDIRIVLTGKNSTSEK